VEGIQTGRSSPSPPQPAQLEILQRPQRRCDALHCNGPVPCRSRTASTAGASVSSSGTGAKLPRAELTADGTLWDSGGGKKATGRADSQQQEQQEQAPRLKEGTWNVQCKWKVQAPTSDGRRMTPHDGWKSTHLARPPVHLSAPHLQSGVQARALYHHHRRTPCLFVSPRFRGKYCPPIIHPLHSPLFPGARRPTIASSVDPSHLATRLLPVV
jgi:hypothetical protein